MNATSDQLNTLARRSTAAIEAADATWRARVAEQVHEPLRRVLAEASANHERALASFESTPHDPRAIWIAIQEYRRQTRDDTLELVLRHLRDSSPIDELGSAYSAFLDVGTGIAESLPEQLTLDEDPELLVSREGDPSSVAVRKWMKRTRRKLRPSAQATNDVPVRRVLGYHIGARLPLLYAPVFERLMRDAARVEASLERAFSLWSRSILVAERDIDTPGVHAQDEVEWPAIPENDDRDEGDDAPADDGVRNNDKPEGDAAEDDGETEPLEKAIEHVVAVGTRLRDALAALLAEPFEAPAVDAALVEVADARLGRDLADYSVGVRAVPATPELRSDYGPAEKGRQLTKAWGRWHQQVVDRVELNSQMLTLRHRILDTEDTILNAVARKTVKPFFDTTRTLETELERFTGEAEKACAAAERGGSVADLHKDLRRIRLRAGRFFERTIRTMPGLVAADEVLVEPGRGIWEAFLRTLDKLPDSLTIHPLPEGDSPPASPSTSSDTIEFREYIQQTLGPVTRRLQPGAAPLRAKLRTTWSRIEEVQNVVLFNLDAAAAEVSAIDSGEESEESEVDPDIPDHARAAARARELANAGLARAREILVEMRRSLQEPWEAFEAAAVEEVQTQWISVLRRLRTDDSDEQWENTWQGLVRQAHAQRRALTTGLNTAWEKLTASAGRAYRRSRRLVRLGQSAVGGVQSTERDLVRAIDELSNVPELRRSMPLVYRHLFTFEPLSEAALHEGRFEDMSWLENQYTHWKATRRGGAIVVSCPQGAGRTSFLNVIAAGAIGPMAGATVVTVPLVERIESEGEVAHLIGQALGYTKKEASTLSALEKRISEVPESKAIVCLIDDLEHLLIRAPGGTKLIERVLVFLSRTDAQIFWVAATNDLVWRYIGASVSSTASGFLTHRQLRPFSAASLGELIMSRHRRSGMALHFDASAVQSEAMRQVFQRRRTEAERQTALRDAYFDRLARLSGQNVMLALFYWIRACTFDMEAGQVTVAPLQPLPLDPIGRLPLASTFALENFLFHRTLSADEHALVARLEPDQSVLLLEALLNLRLIEPAAVEVQHGGIFDASRIEPDSRYRVQPLLLNAVRTALEQRHIVY